MRLKDSKMRLKSSKLQILQGFKAPRLQVSKALKRVTSMKSFDEIYCCAKFVYYPHASIWKKIKAVKNAACFTRRKMKLTFSKSPDLDKQVEKIT